MASSVELYCYGVTWAGCIAATVAWRKERRQRVVWERNALECARTLQAAHRYANWLRVRAPAAEVGSGQGLALQRSYEAHQSFLFRTGKPWAWDEPTGGDPGGPDLAAVPVPLLFEAGKVCALLLQESWLAMSDREWITHLRNELGEYL